MWPWDHVAVAYVCYSLYARLRGRRPSTVAAFAVFAAALAPDAIDKPLAWYFSVLPSGRSLGHSAFTAAGVVAIGWVSHLLGDVAYPLVVKGELRVGFLLWPLVPAEAGSSPGAVGHVSELFAAFIAYLATPAGATYLLVDVTLLLAALVLWVADGSPGAELLRPRSPPNER